jgi:uncharacterized protein (DUF2336 family)
MDGRQSLFAELEDAVHGGSRDRRVDTLRKVTSLFLSGANRFNDEQIELFDDVLMQLIERIETKALGEISEQLAPIERAPIEIVRRLARHDEISVAGPILTHSPRLADSDLVEIAKTKSQAHLLAISGRDELNETVTDVLVDLGDTEVTRRLARNAGAHFSEAGMTTMTQRAEGDESLAELLGRRLDIPLELFRKLLARATEAVRKRLLSVAKPEQQSKIKLVLATIAKDAQETISRDYNEAMSTVQAMHRSHKLNEDALLLFAISKRYEHVVVALSLLSTAPFELIDDLMRGERVDALLIPCKAAGLDWATVRAILKMKADDTPISKMDLEHDRIEYSKLSIATAGRVLRFWQVREKTSSVSSAT